MTIMTPRRRMIRHLSQRRLTDAETFIEQFLSHSGRRQCAAFRHAGPKRCGVDHESPFGKHEKTPGPLASPGGHTLRRMYLYCTRLATKNGMLHVSPTSAMVRISGPSSVMAM